MNELEATFKHAATYLELGIEGIAAAIIAYAVVSCAIAAARAGWGGGNPHAPEAIRLTLGRWLALALEFELASDILGTAVAPSWDEIGHVAAIIVLRTALNFFLQREIRELAEQRPEPAGASEAQRPAEAQA